jgi:hypothetical protein
VQGTGPLAAQFSTKQPHQALRHQAFFFHLRPRDMATNTTAAGQFRIRSARSSEDSSDAHFIVAAWHPTLPFLASIGAGEMWGEVPFSEREGFIEEIKDIIAKAEEDEESDHRRLLIAELCEADSSATNVAAAMIRDELPYYLKEREELRGEIENAGSSILFIEVLVADHRNKPGFKGAGAALGEAIQRRAMERGKERVYVDVWAGNGRKLNKYYETLGFTMASVFSLTRKNGTRWVGTLYWMDLREEGAVGDGKGRGGNLLEPEEKSESTATN